MNYGPLVIVREKIRKFWVSTRVFNKRALVVEESMNVTFDESKPLPKYKELVNDDEAIEKVIKQLKNVKPNDNIILSNPFKIIQSQLIDLSKEPLVIKSHIV